MLLIFLDSGIRIDGAQTQTVYNGETRMNQLDPKTHLLEHTEAKLKLYDTYLAKYINILARTLMLIEFLFLTFFVGKEFTITKKREAQ